MVLAGAGQLALALASLAIPKLLRWREDTARLSSLTRKVFWVYAVYILGTNVALGAVSVLLPAHLLDGSPLARAVCGYGALYWGGRVLVQVVVFHRERPPGAHFVAAETAMLLLFVYLTVVYGGVALALL